MDNRNSKEIMLERIRQLEIKLEAVYNAGEWGIGHVAMANYQSREEEAIEKLNTAMYGEW
jgi:hypothetical protein